MRRFVRQPPPAPCSLAARPSYCPAVTAAAYRVWRRLRASPQYGYTALVKAAVYGKLDCLEHLITKGSNLEATDNVSAAPPAAPSPLRSSALRPRRPPPLLPRPHRRR